MLQTIPTLLVPAPTPVEELSRLRGVVGGDATLLIKRDDSIPFAFGGNKVRKLAFVVARALADGADTLITAGGVQSNHARVTAAFAAKLGLRCVLVVNGEPPQRPTANALLDQILGANIEYVSGREDRAPAMEAVAARIRAEGGRPFVIPLGASTPLGALGYVRAIEELAAQIPAPEVIVCSSSSGGTQAGLVAGCRLKRWHTRVIGVSADERSSDLSRQVAAIIQGVASLIGAAGGEPGSDEGIEVDDSFVGEGYGKPTAASREAIELTARSEAIFLDPTYTAKAMAGLIAYVRQQRFRSADTVLFWHTGGQVALFA